MAGTRPKIIYARENKIGPGRPFDVIQVKKYLSPEVAAQTHVLEVVKGLRRMSHVSDTRMTEVLDPEDPRAKLAEMKQAVKDEVQGLIKRGTFRVVKKRKVSLNSNVLPCKYILAIKIDERGSQRYKARFVIGGHRDRRKAFLVHTSKAVQPSSTRFLLSFSEANDFKMWSEDAPQAYIQTDYELDRELFKMDVPIEFRLAEDECLQEIKPVYGAW